MDKQIQAGFGSGETGRPVALFRRVAEVREAVLQVVALAVGVDDFEGAAVQFDLAGQLEVAVIVAVIAEHQVDLNVVADADDTGVGLHPGVVGRSEARQQQQRRRGQKIHSHGRIFPH